MKLNKSLITGKELKEVSDVALATINEHIDYIMNECVHMAGMGYSYASFTNYQPKMTKEELQGLVTRLTNEHKLTVKVDPYEKEFVDSINIYIEWK